MSLVFDSFSWRVHLGVDCARACSNNSFVTIATYWVLDLPNIKGISGHHFMFANSASCTCSNKHINMLAWVRGLVSRFSSWKSLTYWNQEGGDWKRVSCHGNKMFYSRRYVFCRTVGLPSFNGLRCKLAKIAQWIYSCWVYDVISHLIWIFYTFFKLKYLLN